MNHSRALSCTAKKRCFVGYLIEPAHQLFNRTRGLATHWLCIISVLSIWLLAVPLVHAQSTLATSDAESTRTTAAQPLDEAGRQTMADMSSPLFSSPAPWADPWSGGDQAAAACGGAGQLCCLSCCATCPIIGGCCLTCPPCRCNSGLVNVAGLCVTPCAANPCGAGCPNRCGILCVANNLCDPSCGGSACNLGCSPGVCGSGCPDRCNILCIGNNLCDPACGGSACGLGCSLGVCGTGCPSQCNVLLCPLNLCDAECSPECNILCGGDPCAPGCGGIFCAEDVVAAIVALFTNLLSAGSDFLTNAVDAVGNLAQEAKDAATSAGDNIESIGQSVAEGLQTLTGQVRETITDAISELVRVIAEEFEGREAFVVDGGCSVALCEPFREDLIMLLENIETLSNCMFTLTNQDSNTMLVNLSREIGIVENLPGGVLFPIYRVLGVESNLFGSGFIDQINTLASDLLEIKAAVTDATCSVILDDSLRAEELVRNITMAAGAIKLIGKGLVASGETQFFPDAGIHGYVHVNVQTNTRKKWGERLIGLGDSIVTVTSYADKKVRACIDLRKKNEIRAEVMRGQDDILNAILTLETGGIRADLDQDGDVDLRDYAVFQVQIGKAAS